MGCGGLGRVDQEAEPGLGLWGVVVYTGGMADHGIALTNKWVRLLVLFLSTQKPLHSSPKGLNHRLLWLLVGGVPHRETCPAWCLDGVAG